MGTLVQEMGSVFVQPLALLHLPQARGLAGTSKVFTPKLTYTVLNLINVGLGFGVCGGYLFILDSIRLSQGTWGGYRGVVEGPIP